MQAQVSNCMAFERTITQLRRMVSFQPIFGAMINDIYASTMNNEPTIRHDFKVNNNNMIRQLHNKD